MRSLVAVLVAVLLLVLGLILFGTIIYQILTATEGDITSLQWWLLFTSILMLAFSLLFFIFSDSERNQPQGVIFLTEGTPDF